MPKRIHDRAKHIMSENPDMPESQAWAIATKQIKEKSASALRWSYFSDEFCNVSPNVSTKLAKVVTPLLPHQQRVVDKIQR